MDKIYLVVIDIYDEEENSIVDICTTHKKAEELISQYQENGREHEETVNYHIDEVELDDSKDVLWDCYENPYYVERYGKR